MASLNALQVRDLLIEATQGDNRKTIESTPALSWQLGELDQRIAQLSASLGGRVTDGTLARLQTEAGNCDVEHDEVRRFLFKLMDAASGYGPVETRLAIARGQAVLFPDGLKPLQASYRAEVAAAPDFAQRLERPEVVAALEALAERVKGVKELVRECVRTGEKLTDVMRRLDAAEVEAGATAGGRALFEARNDALRSWATFVTVAEHALAEDPMRRDKLLRRWRRFQEEVRGKASSSNTSTLTAPVSPPADDETVL